MKTFSSLEQQELLTLARHAVQAGTAKNRLQVDLTQYDKKLIQHRACFVTLQRNGSLRGCIGTLEPWRPLVEDVVENAWAAAFRDPRFPAVSAAELVELEFHISVLTIPEPMTFSSEEDLVGQLHPGTDGLILSLGSRRGTFLPSVWESLPDPAEFVRHLKRKAGLDMNFWSEQIKIEKYTAESIR